MIDFTEAEKAVQAIQAKIQALKAPTTLSNWSFKLVPPAAPGAEQAALPWQAVPIPYSWSSADGEGWFRCTPGLPAEVEGIDLQGSRLELDFLLPIGAGIWVNGQERYSEPSWTDTRAVSLELDPYFSPSTPLTLEIHCNAGDGLAQFLQPSLKLSALSKVIFELDLVQAQLTFCRFLTEQGALAATSGPQTFLQAVSTLDLPALNQSQWQDWEASVACFRQILAPFAAEAKTYTAHLVGHSHIDMNWLWPMAETIDVCQRDFTAMLQLMERFPNFHFSQSQAATYRFMEEGYPELFEQIRQKIAAGRWEVTTATWVEGDLNMASGEALAHQLLYGMRYARQALGARPQLCWEPDTFGHPASLPQLLKKSGIDFYYFCRCGKGQNLFWWQGLDGSRVLAVQEPQWYLGTVSPSSIVKSVLPFAQQTGQKDGMQVFGIGDHGGGATALDLQTAQCINDTPLLPQVESSAAETFYRQALKTPGQIPTLSGELNTVFEGCYTSHADIKHLNRQGENALLTAEALTALASMTTGKAFPSLVESWRELCFHQFHDILCGSAIQVTYREAQQAMGKMLADVHQVTAQALSALADQLDTGQGAEVRLVVFNPTAWLRSDLVKVPLTSLDGNVPAALEDSTGRLIPVQIAGDLLIFIAEEVPGLGVQVYHPYAGALSSPASLIADAASLTLHNGRLQVSINSQTGELCRWQDLETGRELVPFSHPLQAETGLVAGFVNQFQIDWEAPHSMSAWDIGKITHTDILEEDAQVRLLEQGPVRAGVEVRRSFLHSRLVQRIWLYRGLRRLDFETEIDWQETGSSSQDAPLLRVSFTPNLGDSQATCEIPFAGLQRPADGKEVPSLRWVDVTETTGAYGVALLNDSKYGHRLEGNTLSLTLLRASYEPDHHPDEGHHTFTYSLYPHAGGWQSAEVSQHATALNQPLLCQVSASHPGSLAVGTLGVWVDQPTVVISTLKLAEDQPSAGHALILRLYESGGSPCATSLTLAFPFHKVEETSLIEEPLTELPFTARQVPLTFSPYEVKTLKVTCLP